MKDSQVKLFAPGDKVWAKPGVAHIFTPRPFWVNTIEDAPADASCKKDHPQMLSLVNENKELFCLLGFQYFFSAWYFTKKEPNIGRKELELSPELQAHINNFTRDVAQALEGSEALRTAKTLVNAKGFQIDLSVSLGFSQLKSRVSTKGKVSRRLLIENPDDTKFLRGLRIGVE